MPTYLELAYEGNYIGKWWFGEIFTYKGKIFFAFPELNTVNPTTCTTLRAACLS